MSLIWKLPKKYPASRTHYSYMPFGELKENTIAKGTLKARRLYQSSPSALSMDGSNPARLPYVQETGFWLLFKKSPTLISPCSYWILESREKHYTSELGRCIEQALKISRAGALV